MRIFFFLGLFHKNYLKALTDRESVSLFVRFKKKGFQYAFDFNWPERLQTVGKKMKVRCIFLIVVVDTSFGEENLSFLALCCSYGRDLYTDI